MTQETFKTRKVRVFRVLGRIYVMNNETPTADYLQELSDRHDEVMERLDDLEKRISSVLDEYLGKVESSAREVQREFDALVEQSEKMDV